MRKQTTGVLLTLGGGVTFLVAALVLMAGQVLGEEIAGWIGLEAGWGLLVSLARIPLVVLLLMAAVSLIYWSAPNTGLPFRQISWGGAAFVVSWALATLGFGFYASNFGSYNATYGSVGSIIVLMTWLYLTALLLLVGAELNVLLERRRVAEGEGEATTTAV